MIGMTIQNLDGTQTSVILCEICWDEGDVPATTSRDGIDCCDSCGDSYDQMAAERGDA